MTLLISAIIKLYESYYLRVGWFWLIIFTESEILSIDPENVQSGLPSFLKKNRQLLISCKKGLRGLHVINNNWCQTYVSENTSRIFL